MIDTELLKWGVGICFGGWCTYLSSERSRIVEDIKKIQKQAETAYTKSETLGTLVHAVFLTKEEHKDFDNRISHSIDKLSERIDKAIDRMVKP